VKNYECIIDTGSARPIAIKGIRYGENEAKYMRQCISALEKLGHISQIHEGGWLFKALLAPKPHQEHVCDIDDFVWRFLRQLHPFEWCNPNYRFPTIYGDALRRVSRRKA
jgi:hypothetical protein